MATNKDEANNILAKWQPLLEKCGHLETLEEKLIFANTLETLRNKATGAAAGDHVLPTGETLNVVNQTGTKRLVISLPKDGDFNIVHQHKDGIDD